MNRRKILRVGLVVGIIFLLVVGQSVLAYTQRFPHQSLQQNVASWARNNYLGVVVDKLEAWTHNDPPSVTPADSLALVTTDTDPVVATTTSTSTSTAIPRTTTTTMLNTGPTIPTTSTTTTTSTTIPIPTTTIAGQPANVSAVILPVLAREGIWVPIQNLRRTPLIWATSIRPLSKYGSVVATAATFDPLSVRVGLFNGTEMPGKGPWINKNKITEKALPSLLGTFNGGFRFEHEPGGYFTEKRTIRKMKKGYATFAIRTDGTSTIGVWGDDLHNDGTWTTLRQNLPPIVQQGRSSFQNYPDIHWGNDYDNKLYTFRSAACLRTDGRIMFVAVGKVNIKMLAQTLIVLGCDTGMQLDINGSWPHFATYSGFGTKQRWGKTLDRRMGDPDRFTFGSTKDFFALFDPQTLPKHVVR